MGYIFGGGCEGGVGDDDPGGDVVLLHVGGDLLDPLVSDGLPLVDDTDEDFFLFVISSRADEEEVAALVVLCKLLLCDILLFGGDVVAPVGEHLEDGLVGGVGFFYVFLFHL